MGALVDDPHAQEERTCHDPVVDHLQDSAFDAGPADGEDPEGHETHVADTRVCDQPFEIALGQSDVGAIKVGESIILVLDIKSPTHTTRKLMDKAEEAVITALLRIWMRQAQAKRLVAVMLDIEFQQFSI